MFVCCSISVLKNETSCTQNEEESGALVGAKEAAIAEQAKAVATVEAEAAKAEKGYLSLQKEYQGMCAGVATDREESRTLTDQVRIVSTVYEDGIGVLFLLLSYSNRMCCSWLLHAGGGSGRRKEGAL